MITSHSFDVIAHQNIYNNSIGRKLKIEFSLNESGINSETGILLLVPGFGGEINSKIYRKMRNFFSAEYNLVVIQCEYFGSEFMQIANNLTINTEQLSMNLPDKLKKKLLSGVMNLSDAVNNYNGYIPATAKLNETLDHFNDMGFMQAIDLITAIESVKLILKDNNYCFNERRIIGYGHSHGAYLLHLSNILSPNLYSFIIDNSSWIKPVYASESRFLMLNYNNKKIEVRFDYILKKFLNDDKILDLRNMKINSEIHTQILCFQGVNDTLVDYKEKEEFIIGFRNSEFIKISDEDVDFVLYNSSKHGLEADFIELFEYAIKKEKNIKKNNSFQSDININNMKITSHNEGLPIFTFLGISEYFNLKNI